MTRVLSYCRRFLRKILNKYAAVAWRERRYDKNNNLSHSSNRIQTSLEHKFSLDNESGNHLTISIYQINISDNECQKSCQAVISKCVTYLRYKQQIAFRQMGDLSPEKVTPSPPFHHTGIDYAGLIQVRKTKKRGHKS
ncbi:hypothetical protein JTB14_034679 [Gonioctena quinquepunctata]|nr:hypothetical protein JTB14_034679 [Gonioctena quinquepunctata]